MVKLVAIDLDGTLFDSKKNISLDNINAIKKAKQMGVKVVIATGRPFCGVRPVLETLDLLSDSDYVICYNGAKVLNVGTQELIFSRNVDGKLAKDLYSFSILNNVNIHAFRDNEELITPKHNPYTDVESRINKVPDHLFDFCKINDDDSFLKVMLVDEKEKLDNIENTIDPHFFEDYSMVRSSLIFLEFLNKETDKGLALEKLSAYLNIDMENVMAIGDAGNDLNMIIKAGYGVAMKNSFPYIKEAAKYQTDDNEHSGVAKAFERFVFNN